MSHRLSFAATRRSSNAAGAVASDAAGTPEQSRLRFLVPSVGRFFTPLLLEQAFVEQDQRRAISSRRFVAPSFNDIRVRSDSRYTIYCYGC